jgi:tetratricopeptide (TPR) repeat protein
MWDRRALKYAGYNHECLIDINGPVKRAILGEDVVLLEHYQREKESRGWGVLKGMAYNAFVDPENARVLHYLGRQMMYCGMYKSAMRVLSKHISLKDVWIGDLSQSMIYIGDCCGQFERFDEQVAWYNRAFNTDPTRREALIRLCYFYKRQNKPFAVAAYANAALAIPWHGNYTSLAQDYREIPHDMLYWSLYRMGMKTEAKQHFLKCCEYRPGCEPYISDGKFFEEVEP